jgi:hypothetical protein
MPYASDTSDYAKRPGAKVETRGFWALVENCPKLSRPSSEAYRSEARHIALSLVLRLRFTRSEQAIGCDMFWENMSNGLLTSASSNSRKVPAVAVDDMDAHRALRLDLPGWAGVVRGCCHTAHSGRSGLGARGCTW